MISAHPELRQALRSGEISIHRAWLYSKEKPEKQQEALELRRGTKEIKRYVRTLISRHQAKRSPDIPDLNYFKLVLGYCYARRIRPLKTIC